MSLFRGLFKSLTGAGQQGAVQPEQQDPGIFNEDLAKFVNDEYAQRQSDRLPFELQWRLNTEFLNGNQHMDINPVSQTLEEIPKMFWYQEREVFNQIATIVETRIAKLGRQKPNMKTRPGSSDDKDVSTAKVTSMLLSSTWNDQSMDERYEDFNSWLELNGTVFWKTTWNTRKGRLLNRNMGQQGQMQQPGQQMPGQQMQMQGAQPPAAEDEPVGGDMSFEASVFGRGQQLEEIREGDIDTVVVPAHEIFPDSPWRSGFNDVRSVIHARAFHLDEIEDMWNVRVEAEEVDVMTLQRTTSGMGGLGYMAGTMRTSVMRLKNHAVLKEYYEKPSRKYPLGRYIVVAGNKTLYAGPMPYMIGQDGEPEFPFIRVVSIDRPGCFWGKTVLERCIPVQRRYNALRNRKADYLNLVAIGQWTAPENSLQEGTELNNAPGNIIYYRPGINGSKPEPVPWPNLPASFENEIDTLMSEFTSISGVSELSRFAEAPDGVKSGVALGVAKEQDDTRIATSVARVANSVVHLGKYWIRLYRQFVQEPRLLRYVGGNREVDVREWTTSDLRSDDVFIENMAALAETPAQRRQMVFDLLSAGLFSRPEMSNLSPEGRQKVFQLLEFGHWEFGADDDLALHRSRARRENRDFMEGKPAQVMDFDNHLLHIEQHNRMRMQSEWEEALRSPFGQVANELMMAHIAEHIQLALQAMPKEPAPEQKPGDKKDDSKEPAKG